MRRIKLVELRFVVSLAVAFLLKATLLGAVPTVDVLESEAFVRAKGDPVVEELVFVMPNGGSATLEILNGSKDDGLTGERISSSVLSLNGIEVVSPDSFNQKVELIEVPVELVGGPNKLAIELRGKPGGCIVLRIHAPVDLIDLQPISGPLEVNVDTMDCEAVVSALGVAAPDIDVQFDVAGFGVISPLIGKTDTAGLATVTFDPFSAVGVGAVAAQVVGSSPLLQDSEPFEVANIQALILDQGLSSIVMEVGQTQYTAYTISLVGAGGQPTQVIFSQEVVPSNGGITLNSDYPMGGWITSDDTVWPVNESINGLALGAYTVTSTATIVGSGESVSKVLHVDVVDPNLEIPTLWAPGCEPDAINPSIPSDVTFSVLISGVASPLDVELVQLDPAGVQTVIGQLKDDGANGDPIAGDNIYSAAHNIVEDEAGKLRFQAKVVKDGITYESLVCFLTVTDLPIGPAPSDPSALILDPSTGVELYSNEILVGMFPQISDLRVLEIATAEGATIVGTVPALNVFQIRILGESTLAGVQTAVAAFKAYPEVEYAEAVFYGNVDEFKPNDPKYSIQSNMTKIRADEAWVVAKGAASITIGIIDTGVDYNHDDLKPKVIKGKNYADGNNDPDDTHGHGTHVAGIAAAESNNGVGVAGVAWDSKILAVRWTDGITGSDIQLAAAIRYAADNSAKILSISGGTADTKKLKKAIKYAASKGALICASAGNSGTEKKRFPGSYDECFCVGNTKNDDTRAASSSYGSWVDISAPGEGVESTWKGNTYNNIGGTSMSTPLVSGAAAVVWSMHPSWTAAQVRERLEKTAEPLPASLKIGVGRIDLFEAVFNGSFEIGDLSEWSKTGTCSSLEKLGALMPQHGKRMGYASTGPAGDQQAATLEKTFTIQPGVTSLPFKFEYNFLTEEYPEFVGSSFDDSLRIVVTAPNGSQTTIVSESVNGSSFSLYGDSPAIDFPGGDNTVGQTGWKTATANIPVTGGSGKYTIEVQDAGDDIYDSVILIDNIRIK